MPRILNFSEFPADSAFEARSLLLGVPKDMEVRLLPLPQILERVRSASYLAELSSKQDESWLAAAYLRAALADYCSIEEMQKIDRPSTVHINLATVTNPLLHLLELMRHLNIHVKSSQAERVAVAAKFDSHPFDLPIQVVSNLEAQDLIALRNGKHYAPSDLRQMVTWFNKAQLHWGAGYVVRLGVEAFAELICIHNCL